MEKQESSAENCTQRAQQTGLESVMRDMTARLSQPEANRRSTGKFRGVVAHNRLESSWLVGE